MSGDLSLFGDDEAAKPVPQARTETPIADWQVGLLRRTLTAHGLTTMAERQRAIEAAAERPIDSLRPLTHPEALRVLSRLGPPPTAQQEAASAWDNRDEDTWIDRL